MGFSKPAKLYFYAQHHLDSNVNSNTGIFQNVTLFFFMLCDACVKILKCRKSFFWGKKNVILWKF